MRKSFGARALSYPQPVLMIATYGVGGTPDVMKEGMWTSDSI